MISLTGERDGKIQDDPLMISFPPGSLAFWCRAGVDFVCDEITSLHAWEEKQKAKTSYIRRLARASGIKVEYMVDFLAVDAIIIMNYAL